MDMPRLQCVGGRPRCPLSSSNLLFVSFTGLWLSAKRPERWRPCFSNADSRLKSIHHPRCCGPVSSYVVVHPSIVFANIEASHWRGIVCLSVPVQRA
ncbi:hypothetical protein SODALDRAFT_9504 [Sodiomyces alkalinus F11]|uniref:Uncharacterized protein n=1 Tax=Sodiomyces alkalinus (strain CBS 110278 / VKM F-3762 / F11) TaxID=1314773 RepID=A0A3N2Q658_SODAK|nr:hypothetical protein SODALDRAFT_9504 [Sodiomyces alkalinus F11]ROT42186.1 hypothetical protein SODALDRAFT_9504 [Sodiomyces alkalinus F11]